MSCDNSLYPQGIFENCRSLESLNIKKFTMLKAINLNAMFRNCYSLTSLDISGHLV